MKKYLILIFAFFNITCMNNNYTEFKPIEFNGEEFVEKEVADTGFYKNLKRVLNFYDETYKVDDNGVIWIKQSKSDDKDLLQNYTKKANDPQWLMENGK